MELTNYSLDQLLILDKRPVEINPSQEYSEIGIRSFGRGIFHKSPRLGFEIGNKRLFLIKAGDLIFQITFAWEGAIAIASEGEDGLYGSTRFPTYRIDSELCVPKYLLYYFRTSEGLAQIKNISPGSAGRNRVLSTKRFSEVIVPLPPLKEQRRLLSLFETIANRIESARLLRKDALRQTEVLFESTLRSLWAAQDNWQFRRVKNLATTVSTQVDPKSEPYASLPHINGQVIESGTCRLLPKIRPAKDDGIVGKKYHFRANTIVYSKIRPYLRKATEVPFEGICSTDIYAFDVISDDLEPRFFMYSLIAPAFSSYAIRLSRGTRTPRINQKHLLDFDMAYPCKSKQMRIVEHLDEFQSRATNLKSLQAQTQIQLNELLQSVLDSVFDSELTGPF